MIACNCIVQAGQISAETEASLRTFVNDFAERHFGTPAEISWMAIPEKSGFTAARPSTSSIISMRANMPVSQADRETLLRELCSVWARETGRSLDEIVGVLSDPMPN
ncbi:MAG: hypothetical protein QNI84_03365 [Henriciella sp.]|nr:hypothetical protein [Henriciella sp.]